MKIKFSKEVSEFIRNNSSVVQTKNGNLYYHLPFWYKGTNEEDIFEEFGLDQTPEDLKTQIIKNREL